MCSLENINEQTAIGLFGSRIAETKVCVRTFGGQPVPTYLIALSMFQHVDKPESAVARQVHLMIIEKINNLS
jgi:hypothetical protein